MWRTICRNMLSFAKKSGTCNILKDKVSFSIEAFSSKCIFSVQSNSAPFWGLCGWCPLVSSLKVCHWPGSIWFRRRGGDEWAKKPVARPYMEWISFLKLVIELVWSRLGYPRTSEIGCFNLFVMHPFLGRARTANRGISSPARLVIGGNVAHVHVASVHETVRWVYTCRFSMIFFVPEFHVPQGRKRRKLQVHFRSSLVQDKNPPVLDHFERQSQTDSHGSKVVRNACLPYWQEQSSWLLCARCHRVWHGLTTFDSTMHQAGCQGVQKDCSRLCHWFLHYGLHWLHCEAGLHPNQQHHCGWQLSAPRNQNNDLKWQLRDLARAKMAPFWRH